MLLFLAVFLVAIWWELTRIREAMEPKDRYGRWPGTSEVKPITPTQLREIMKQQS